MASIDLALAPDVYEPVLNSKGEYCDRLPAFTTHARAISCPCTGNRRPYKRSSLIAHFKTAGHRSWLGTINANKDNHLRLYTEAQTTVHSQKLIIAGIQKELDVAQQRLSGMGHILRGRDARIVELESELFMHRPPPDMQEGDGGVGVAGGSGGGEMGSLIDF